MNYKMNTINIIAIGDQHFKVDNIQIVDLFIEKITELVSKTNPDFVVLLGDLLDTHERLHTIPLNRAYKFINNIRKISKTFVLVGNHDLISNTSYLKDDHWLNAMKEWDNVTIVDKVILNKIKNRKFIFCPYVSPGRFEEALSTLNSDNPILNKEEKPLIFAHQEFFGCKMGAFNSIEGDKWESEWPNVISGHIHLNQKPQENIYYPGSSIPVAFGETAKNIIALIKFIDNKDEYILEEIELEIPKKHIIYTDTEKVSEINIPDSEDTIKLSISGEYEEFKTFKGTVKYKELTKKGVKIVFKQKRKEIKDKKEALMNTLENNTNNFNDIIHQMVQNQKDSYLYEAYQLVVNSKEVNSDDILFL